MRHFTAAEFKANPHAREAPFCFLVGTKAHARRSQPTAFGTGMKSFNPFRMSFDRPLRPVERTRARVTATIVGGAAIFLGISSVGALLNASSEAIGSWTNAEPPAEARIVTTDAPDMTGKSCEEQTWPYLEARCLKSADTQTSPRATPKHGLGSQQISLPDAPATNAARPPISPAADGGTTGSAAYDDQPAPVSADSPGSTNVVAVPLPVPAPARDSLAVAAPVQADSAGTVSEPEAAQHRSKAERQLSKREQRRLQRQERKRLQRQRREEARQLRRERFRARQEARRDDFFIFR
jgi:hypothetical protein